MQQAKCKAAASSDWFQPAAAVEGLSSVRMPRMDLLVRPAGDRCAHQLVVQDGLHHHLDLRQPRGGLRLEGECIQRHNHCNLHICKIRQGGGDGAATLWDQEPSRDGQGSHFAAAHMLPLTATVNSDVRR